MDQLFNLEEYLGNGIEDIVKNALKASLKNPKESIFITKFIIAANKARSTRRDFEAKGEHIPPFLIASITSSCNLHCTGCYARANHICEEKDIKQQLTAVEWDRIFREAEELGVTFILLAGGEPLMRQDILEKAAIHKNILYPVFTNGTLIKDSNLLLFDKNRNLVPVLSIEGDKEYTDSRRGSGIYQVLCDAMDRMKKKGILFGTSITVTKDNIRSITGDTFIMDLKKKGCKVVFMVEYVPVGSDLKELAPGDEERSFMDKRLLYLRQNYENMIFIYFPGDEKVTGGCLAAGRGFFHINPSGSAEPCPFSPYSDTNLKEVSVLEALRSPLFRSLADNQILMKEHVGGCVLFEQEEEVRKLASLI